MRGSDEYSHVDIFFNDWYRVRRSQRFVDASAGHFNGSPRSYPQSGMFNTILGWSTSGWMATRAWPAAVGSSMS